MVAAILKLYIIIARLERAKMISRKTGVSIFFPCFNDRRSIGKLIEASFSTIKKYTNKYEVIVVDDFSTDSSRLFLEKLAKKYRRLKIVLHKKNLGYGGALRTGFNKAKYEMVFYTDGDGQYDVRELPLLLSLMTKDVDFINGIKMSRHDPTYRIVIGNLYSFLTRWLFWVPILDIDCDFRLIRKSLLDKLNLKSNSGAICIELIKRSQRAGGKFRQVSIHHLERRFGVSQFFRVNKILITLSEVFWLWLELMMIFKLFKIARKMRLHPLLSYQYNPTSNAAQK